MKHYYSTFLLAMAIAMPAAAQHEDHRSLHLQPKHQFAEMQKYENPFAPLIIDAPQPAEAKDFGAPALRDDATKQVWLSKYYTITTVNSTSQGDKTTTILHIHNTYNNIGEIATQIRYNDGEKDGYLFETTYDANGNITQIDGYSYNIETKEKRERSRITNFYEGVDGQISKTLTTIYKDGVGFENYTLQLWTYPENPVSGTGTSVSYNWDAVNQKWKEIDKFIHNYSCDEASGNISDINTKYYVCGNINYEINNHLDYAAGKPVGYIYKHDEYAGSDDVYADYAFSKKIFSNIVYTSYNVDYSKWNNWSKLEEALGGNYQSDVKIISGHVKDGKEKDVSESNIKMAKQSGTNDGLPYYIFIEDWRNENGFYGKEHYQQTDEFGSSVKTTYHYKNLAVGEAPSDDKLMDASMDELMMNANGDYTYNFYISLDNDNPTSLSLRSTEWRTTKYNTEHGYCDSVETGSTYFYSDGTSQSRVETYNYYDYEKYTINAISCITTDGSGEQVRRVYNTSGVCVGTATDNLPSGLYIVREDSRTYKMLKK